MHHFFALSLILLSSLVFLYLLFSLVYIFSLLLLVCRANFIYLYSSTVKLFNAQCTHNSWDKTIKNGSTTIWTKAIFFSLSLSISNVKHTIETVWLPTSQSVSQPAQTKLESANSRNEKWGKKIRAKYRLDKFMMLHFFLSLSQTVCSVCLTIRHCSRCWRKVNKSKRKNGRPKIRHTTTIDVIHFQYSFVCVFFFFATLCGSCEKKLKTKISSQN